jgi:four helix bundle protein
VKRGHRELRVWQKAVELVEHVYRLTEAFPKSETYGLAQQMRRAAVSVPSNIAEGAARKGTRELLRFSSIASGSLAELDTQLEVAARLNLVGDEREKMQAMIDEVSALVLALMGSLRAKLD